MRQTFMRPTLFSMLVCISLIGCSANSPKTASNVSSSANVSNQGKPGQPSPAAASDAKGLKLLPVDEASKDPSLVAFRQRLISAVEKKDHQYIRSILDPNIVVSFGGDGGVKDFFEFWKPERPESELWQELATILSMGGSFEPTEGEPSFWVPYVFSTWDRLEDQLKGDDDVFTHAAIVAENVEMKSAPDPGATILSMLSYDVVKVDYESSVRESGKDSFAWVKITMSDGKTGFVEGRFIRSPIDYRAGFQKKGDRWRMTALVAGD
jgi:hypothetical protein